MAHKDKATRRAYDKKYLEEHRELILARRKKYRLSDHEGCLRRNRKWRQKNKLQIRTRVNAKIKANMDSWMGLIPKITQCPCCGKDIFFASGIKIKSIHFDHRSGGTESIRSPSVWLMHHSRTPANEAIWKTCNFGMLCLKCNSYLPTENRMLFIKQLNNYVGGINA